MKAKSPGRPDQDAEFMPDNSSPADNYSSPDDDSSSCEEVKGETSKRLRKPKPSDAQKSNQQTVKSPKTYSSALIFQDSNSDEQPDAAQSTPGLGSFRLVPSKKTTQLNKWIAAIPELSIIWRTS